MKLSKKQLAATLMTAVLAGSVMIGSVATVEADNASGSPEEQADITNWIANTPEQISNNMAMQHINTNNLNGTRYIIQWGDTLSGISAATGISVAKLCYDNNIQNANLIFAGDVLILNREGSVPAGYDPNVNPNVVAQTKITINNGPTTVNIAVQPQSVVKNYDNSDNSDHSTTIYKAGAVNSFNNNGNDNEQSDSQSSSTKSAKHQKHTSSVSASDIVSGLNDANNNDKLSFDEGDGGSDADELNVDSAAILKDAKKNDYDAILSEIESALGSKAKKNTTIYIEKDGSEIHVYASVNDDDSSNSSSTKDDEDSDSSSSSESESSDDSSQSSSDDEDSHSQATTSDQDTDTSDDE
ncbi:LysM peptidoglycan-binding domain-containing protein [Limosilactobacillus reuteri]|uniref:LysM peptidoglycan-binding domain-containing protein n=1 Tax=Limosilactobacillus reuteri TaxID=1598 RepID=UPI001E3B1F00|nr:LysM domain-containing protein [Limosilactobacillus reuteri]MCC4397160.1 LysM peptidoglycan-binding domain-containing protein [Limosilactobacillus reuteri]MCC4409211.1 LysM peptidoglycan-binding domain-containing protein [Limosilactobacillus reuteri]MCC4422251.1 LysM peptidoglycan-binding domain-containing protein [Limosilactobacillus reuteri]